MFIFILFEEEFKVFPKNFCPNTMRSLKNWALILISFKEETICQSKKQQIKGLNFFRMI